MRYLSAVAILAAALVTAFAVAGTATGNVDLKKRLTTTLTGAEEVPPADPDGAGNVILRLNTRMGQRVCWNFTVSNIGTATAAHIHKAPMGMNGGIVVDLSPAPGDADDGMWMGCRTGVGRALIRDIIRNPTSYYVNVHNMEFPGGAIRGQLGD
jgi:hypothetical protein